MATSQMTLFIIGALIVFFVILHSISRFFKNRHNVSANIEEENQEEDFPSVQDEVAEEIEEVEEAEELLTSKVESSQAENIIKTPAEPNHFMMVSVHAKPDVVFSDYSFLQTMGSVGLIYGEHKIFHYDVKTDQGIQPLFSVAQLNKPGTFNIDHVETINCKGLLLFIDLRACRKQTLALDCMLETAYQLAEDLDGIMYEGYNTPWQEDTPRALSQQLEQYQKNNKNILDEISY